MAESFVYRPGHPEANENGMVTRSRASRQSDNITGPQVISDTMPPTWHPCDGKIYESKKRFRDTTRAHGGLEVGNEKITPRTPQAETPDRVYQERVERAIYEIENPWARSSKQ